jgi:hypothetical protein
MTLREYIGEHNIKFIPGSPSGDPYYHKRNKDGEKIFYEILDRVRKMGPSVYDSSSRSKTAGSVSISH